MHRKRGLEGHIPALNTGFPQEDGTWWVGQNLHLYSLPVYNTFLQ